MWDVDALAYVCTGIATLLASRVLAKAHRWTRRALFAHAAVTPLIAIVYSIRGSPYVSSSRSASRGR